jgi:hypothetical protein
MDVTITKPNYRPHEGTVSVSGGTVVPAPTNLQATAVSSSQINLTWEDNSTGEDHFEIQRKTGSGSFSTITTVGTGVTSYSDTGLSPDTTYTYRVRAHAGGVDSDWSNEDSATTASEPLPPPSNLQTTAVSDSQIDLTWVDNSDGEDHFEIQRRTTGSFSTIATVGTGLTSYSDTGLSPNTTYTYRVRAHKDGVDSAWSNEDAATTQGGGDIVFQDDFESDKGWTRLSGSATTGLWERGVPDPTSYSSVSYQIAAASGSYDLVTGADDGGSVGGNDIDSGTTSIRSPNIALPDGDVTLSFKYYFAHYSNASSDDFLRVRVVGSTTSTVFEELGAGNVDGATWEEFSADISGFGGQMVYLLIEAADGGSGSLVEAGVDDVLITGSGTPPQPPAAPSNLDATAVSESQIDLTWTDNSTDEDSFEIQRRTAGSFATIATVGADVTSYSDTGLSPETTYTYRVRAVNSVGDSAWSNEASATTLEEPGVVFEDDFESDKGWTRLSGSATTGLWERANPESTSYSGVDYQLGTTASGSYDLVTEGAAGSSVGANDIDGGTTSIRSPEFTIPGGGATLSFKYYLSHYSNASSEDFLRVRVVVVGGSTTTVFEELGAGNVDGAAWETFSTSLDTFAGDTVYLLIEAADGGSGSLVEAAIDDVLIE